MPDPQDEELWTIRALAERFAGGKYHEVYHQVRKGALEVQRPARYHLRVTSTAAQVVYGPEAAQIVKRP